jgi:squalene-hopene/tetraprenyl-beta-curcumene cyclase
MHVMTRAIVALVLVAPSFVIAADVPQPKPTKPDEPLAPAYSPAKAAAYLDGVGVNWTRDRKCATCHTNIPYLMARPVLRGDDAGWKEVRAFLEADVAKWKAGKPRGDAYVVVTAVALAVNDARTTGKLSPAAKDAFAAMWKAQKTTGEWDWIKCDWPPLEHDDYYGAALAAVGVGTAPGEYAASDAAKPGLARLRDYLRKTPPPDLHHKTMLLWASAGLDGLMTLDDQRDAVAALKAKQRADGGWALPSLGNYARNDGTANDPAAPSDGYATGFVVYVLRQAGVPADDPAVAKGVAWLKANQRASGRWFTRSLNNDKAHYIANAGTAYAVLALDACGVAVAAK